ncbi:DoxX family protein [Occultella gossypii]|uniref:DoxX family protein n=1 Tax=Occultella gossypii TaxID=2800820 RepID=A0ABS7S6C0_9MICO|nr:DoxX family protein [Occultella gossypii]MBZ2194861.1 DoxX family protein [Occultella gossypii]
MEPVIVLVGVTGLLLALGRVGVRPLRTPAIALRGGLAAMFLLTGGSHFIGMRPEMIAMVPDWVPAPELVVTLTGLAEIAGAIGLLWSRTVAAAATCLTLLLVVMFPANVHLALSGDPLPWWDELLPRTFLQLVFLAATATVAVDAWRRLRRGPGRRDEDVRESDAARSGAR